MCWHVDGLHCYRIINTVAFGQNVSLSGSKHLLSEFGTCQSVDFKTDDFLSSSTGNVIIIGVYFVMMRAVAILLSRKNAPALR